MTMTETKTINPILMDLPMPITTPRLVIRPAMAGDGAAMNAAKAETWEQIKIWMPWAKTMSSIDEDEETARRAYAKFLLREDFMMLACDRTTGIPVVFTGLHRFDWAVRRFEIGYWCRKSAQGQGFVTESTNALARYAFAVLGARAVAICHADGNDASHAVIARVGFRPEGRAVSSTMTNDGIIRDHLWYSHTRIEDLPDLAVSWG